MDQGQQAPQAQPAGAAAPLVLPPPPPALPAAPAPRAFALGPGWSHAVLDYDDPNTGAMATKLYSKAILPLEEKFDGEADNLAIFLAIIHDRARHFNWQCLIMVPIDDGTTRNILTHHGQVSLENTRTHAMTYVNTPTRDAEDNDMFYYFLVDSLTNKFHTMVLLYAEVYTVTNVPVTSSLLKQIIILTRVDNSASTMHIHEMLIKSKCKLLLLKGNITEFNQWVRKQMGCLHPREQEAVELLYYLWKAYKATPDKEFEVYIKDLKSQCDDRRATFTAENLMVRAENKYEVHLLDEENAWGKPTEEQEKIIAMSAEINSLKRNTGALQARPISQSKQPRNKPPRKLQLRKPLTRRKRAATNGHGKISHPKIRTLRKMRLLLKLLKIKSIIGARTITMVRVCGHSTIQMIVRAAQAPIAQHPMPTSLLSTPWTVTLTRSDCCARVKASLGSG